MFAASIVLFGRDFMSNHSLLNKKLLNRPFDSNIFQAVEMQSLSRIVHLVYAQQHVKLY